MTPVARLQRLGVLKQRTLCAHCVHLDAADTELMRASGASVIYNPDSNMKLSCGVAPIELDMGEAVLEPLLLETKAVATLGRMLNLALSRDGWPLPARMHDNPTPLPPERRVLH